ncbi:MAG: sel1 repeat family protein, partial [Gammaproteobacteria bacterium]|nr:sel1 repeat family protein [Gammaproteobacteria bacterium]
MLSVLSASSFADYQTGYDAWLSGDYATAMSEWKAVAATTPERDELARYREALYGIGMLYWQGHGVEQDYSVATVWLKQAADINHPGAQTKLGYLYSMGLGVPQNFDEAAKWFRMAAAQGDENARDNLQALEQQGLITAQSEAATTEAAPELVDAPRAKAKIESTVAPEAGPVTPLPGQDAGEDWIRDQDPEHYTI